MVKVMLQSCWPHISQFILGACCNCNQAFISLGFPCHELGITLEKLFPVAGDIFHAKVIPDELAPSETKSILIQHCIAHGQTLWPLMQDKYIPFFHLSILCYNYIIIHMLCIEIHFQDFA